MDLGFLLCLLAGIIAAIIFVIKVIGLPDLLNQYPHYVYALFFGLILASVPMVLRRTEGPRDRLSWLICLALGAAFAIAIVTQKPVHAPEGMVWSFAGGAVAICAMLLPGISGSFILLMTGQYLLILEAVDRFDFEVLAPFILGCIFGILAFSRVINWLLRGYYNATLYFMAGLLLGSLWMIWPFQNRQYEFVHGKSKLVSSTPYWPEWQGHLGEVAIIGLMVVGVIIVSAMDRMAKKMPG